VSYQAGSFSWRSSKPSDLLGICLGLIGAALVLGGAYYATILINKDPRDIEPCQKLTAIVLLLSGLLLSLAGLSGAVWDELTETQSHTSGGNASGSGSN
jgi:hypothetical protein